MEEGELVYYEVDGGDDQERSDDADDGSLDQSCFITINDVVNIHNLKKFSFMKIQSSFD